MSEPFHIVERESFREKKDRKQYPGNGRSFKHRDSRRS